MTRSSPIFSTVFLQLPSENIIKQKGISLFISGLKWKGKIIIISDLCNSKKRHFINTKVAPRTALKYLILKEFYFGKPASAFTSFICCIWRLVCEEIIRQSW